MSEENCEMVVTCWGHLTTSGRHMAVDINAYWINCQMFFSVTTFQQLQWSVYWVWRSFWRRVKVVHLSVFVTGTW